MKYFFDTEFHEYAKRPYFGRWGKPIDTIELISIGIVAEDGREYYAVCKEFDVDAAWENEWLVKHVLKPIWIELSVKKDDKYTVADMEYLWSELWNSERRARMKLLINLFGSSRKKIAVEIKDFVYMKAERTSLRVRIKEGQRTIKASVNNELIDVTPEFYAYYADYDWVVFCWLFGRMIDLPKGFPMYCRDLKQMFDQAFYGWPIDVDKIPADVSRCISWTGNEFVLKLKEHHNYPADPDNEHNALADARWNKQLFDFIRDIQHRFNRKDG